MLWTAAGLIVLGVLITWATWEVTEGEYPFTWWLGWSLMASGVLTLVAGQKGLRADYLLWSSGIALVFLLSFALGKIEDEYLPTAWVATGVLASNAVLYVFGVLFTFEAVLLTSLVVLAVGALFLGYKAREKDEYGYDAGYSIGFMAIFTFLLVFTHGVRTPLQHLNEVSIPTQTELRSEVNSNLTNYQPAFEQAKVCAGVIENDFVEEDGTGEAYVDTVEEHFVRASALIESAGVANTEHLQTYESQAQWSEQLQERLNFEIGIAEQARKESTESLTELDSVCNLWRTLAQEYVRTFLWFETARYWPSESSDSNHMACYYGELLATVDSEQNLTEVIVSDEDDFPEDQRKRWGSDSKDRNWKIFTKEDYVELVNLGIIAPMGNNNPSETDIGYYLCGKDPQNGQFGVLGEPPIKLVKEKGTTTWYQEDEDTFVGNYEYGSWCSAGPDGKYVKYEEEENRPGDAEWCWYNPEGESTGHYYRRAYRGNSWIYIRGPRRCVYCTSQPWSGGGTLVPDRRMSEINQTDATTLRGNSDLGGGPGTGK